jgi:hypothetical protein
MSEVNSDSVGLPPSGKSEVKENTLSSSAASSNARGPGETVQVNGSVAEKPLAQRQSTGSRVQSTNANAGNAKTNSNATTAGR